MRARFIRARFVRAQRVTAFARYLRFLERSFATTENLEQVQADGLVRVVARAYRHVPFQRQRMDEAGLRPEHLRHPGDLTRLPVVTKRELREVDAEDLTAMPLDARKVRSKATSGSSGEPLRFYLDQTYLDRGSAVRTFVYHQLGSSSGSAAELFDSARARGQRALAPRGVDRHVVHYRLPVEEQADIVERIAPAVVYGNRSHLVALAEEYERRGERSASLAWAVSSSETLHAADRAVLADWLAPSVHDLYGLAEVETVAFQPKVDGAYQVLMPRVVVEVLRDGVPAAPGESGEVVVTGLDNPVMPFLRYATGDIATVAAVSPRGTVVALRSIEGRTDDRLLHRDGRMVAPWEAGTSAFWGRAGIAEHLRQWQIAQDAKGAVVVTVVPRAPMVDGMPEQIRDEIKGFIQTALGGMSVTVLTAPHIDLEPNGKFRAIKSAARAPTRGG